MNTVNSFYKLCRDSWLVFLSSLSCLLLFCFMAWLVVDIFYQGLSGLSFDFLWAEPTSSGRSGGIFPILVSTFYIVSVCILVALPLSLFTAVFLFFVKDRYRKIYNILIKSIDILAAIPSIVFGLFGNAFFVIKLDLGYSILTGGLTLACMVLPTLIRSVQMGLESVPKDVLSVSSSLGLSQLNLFIKVLLPLSLPSLILGCILGLARALAETAALLFTSGYADRIPESLLDSGRSLSIHIYELAMNIPGGNSNAYTSALVLVIVLFMMNSLAITIGDYWIKKSGVG